MPRMESLAYFLIAIVLIGFAGPFNTFRIFASPGTLRVPTDYPTIQSAIDNAISGDTIFVYNGTYKERVIVSQSLNIVGQNGSITTIDGDGLGTVINVTASGVNVSGFTIRNCGLSENESAINLYLVGDCSIFENNIRENSVGISLYNASDNRIYHNNFVDNTLHANISGEGFVNFWDAGYPSGGNYWSNYTGSDKFRGPAQDQPGSDGIVDTQYLIPPDNVDRYPYLSYWRLRIVKNLDTQQSYASIQEAIDASETMDGSRLLICRGVYYENVIVNKGVLLIGESVSETIIDGGGVGDVIYIGSNYASITGLSLRRSGSLFLDSAIHVHNANMVSMSTSTIINSSIGIYLDNSNECIVERNNLSYNRLGISLNYASTNHLLTNNISSQTDKGMLLRYSNSNRIEQNSVINAFEGLKLEDSFNNTVDSNIFRGNNYDARLLRSHDNRLSGNSLTNSWAGFALDYSTSNMIAGNNVSHHTNVGISLFGSANNTIYYNSFIGNTFQASVSPAGYRNIWNTGYPVGGNYWSDYVGVDVKNGPNQDKAGGDGIGDTAYQINSDNKDNYPQMQALNLTTAVDVHDVAVRNITVSENRILEGRHLTITVTVSNLGNYTEAFAVSTYYDGNMIGTSEIAGLAPRSSSILSFSWATVGVAPNKTYAISASATSVPGEGNLGNNHLAGPSVTVLIYRDASISDAAISSNVVYQGFLVNITALVSNLGNVTENLTVRLFYDEKLAETQVVAMLVARTGAWITFLWNTSNVAPCRNYSVAVKVDPLPDEASLLNNNVTAGNVKVRMVGDVNADKVVNILDIATIAVAFRSRIGQPKYDPLLDFDSDGIISIIDIAKAAKNFNRTCF